MHLNNDYKDFHLYTKMQKEKQVLTIEVIQSLQKPVQLYTVCMANNGNKDY